MKRLIAFKHRLGRGARTDFIYVLRVTRIGKEWRWRGRRGAAGSLEESS